MKYTALDPRGPIWQAKPVMFPIHHQVSPSAISPLRINPPWMDGEGETETQKTHGHVHKPEPDGDPDAPVRDPRALCPCGFPVLLPASM